MLVNVSQAVGVNLLIWSGLHSIAESSGGKYTGADHFESKAAVTKYAQKSGIPFANIQAGFYASNYEGHFKPRKQDDGSYVLSLPIDPEGTFPVIDMIDYGLFVRRAIEVPGFGAGSELLAHAESISVSDCLSEMAAGVYILPIKVHCTHCTL